VAGTKQVILNGDSTSIFKRVKTPVNCIITDPPFGVNNQSNSATTEEGKFNARKIANDETPEKALEIFDLVMKDLLPLAADECDLYIFTAHQVLEQWIAYADTLRVPYGFERKGILVWAKDGPGMGDLNSWGMSHEFIIFLRKGGRIRTDRRRSGVLSVPQVRPTDLIHPHEKPLALLEMLIQHSTSPGDFVVDPFAGSGSTIRACRRTQRNAMGVEYDRLNWERAVKALDQAEGMF
jgi:adenine-specific DNA-methyltransferase